LGTQLKKEKANGKLKKSKKLSKTTTTTLKTQTLQKI